MCTSFNNKNGFQNKAYYKILYNLEKGLINIVEKVGINPISFKICFNPIGILIYNRRC